MILEYTEKLIENLPENIKNGTTRLDLVLDGGVFNGSYLIGALFFLKEMEKRKYVVVERISGCSIGSLCGLLYCIDALELFYKLYELFLKDFKEGYYFKKIKEIGFYLKDVIPESLIEKVNNKLFITYYNISSSKKKVKSVYKSKEDVIDSIIKSCFLPFIIDGNIMYKNKYIDGINPYIFTPETKGTRILFLDLYGYDKVSCVINVKNEKSNFHRILVGMLDIHNFYIKQTATSICSYTDEWGFAHNMHFLIKQMLERIIICSVYIIIAIKKIIPFKIRNHLIYKIMTKIFFVVYESLLETMI